MIDLNKEKLKLNYPCSWKYKMVVLESININNVVKDILSDRENKVSESNVSKKGKFKSYTLELLVHSDDDRTEIYKLLGDHSDIKMVL